MLTDFRTLPIADKLLLAALCAYPALLLTVKGGMNGVFLLVLLLSAYWLWREPRVRMDRASWLFALAMSLPVLAIFATQAAHGTFKASAYDASARFLLAVPIFLALRGRTGQLLPVLRVAFPLGVLVTVLSLLITPRDWLNLTSTQFSNHIHFGDMSLMLGFLALLAARRLPREWLIGGIACAAGGWIVVQSGSRGGWMAFPVLAVMAVLARVRLAWKTVLLTLCVVGVLSVLTYFSVETVQQRVSLGYQNVVDFSQGKNPDSSVGVRLQLWHAAWHSFSQNIWFGLGTDGFAHAMPQLGQAGMLTPVAVKYGQAEVHSEILSKCAAMGILGLLSSLAVLFVPLGLFMRARRTDDADIRTASWMGMTLVVGFVIFGLTAELFNLKMTAAFFSFTLAVLLAAAMPHISRKS